MQNEKIETTEIYQNDYLRFYYDHHLNSVVLEYGSESEFLTDEAFKEAMQAYATWVEAHRPTRLLLDNRQMKYIISPEMQAWVVENISPRTQSIARIAVVVSPDLFAEISTEQGLDDIQKARSLQTRSFQTIEAAIRWLVEE